MSELDELRAISTVVSDTGDIESIAKYHPQDATTNPSLILAAVEKPQYHALMDEAVKYGQQNASSPQEQIKLIMDKLFVNFGVEILKIVPGRVSTEVDARLSFDVEGSILKARALIALYEKMGIDRNRILIKLASTWEGGLAAKELEQSGIHCNMTLMFSLPQAIHCAASKATLISPFVGRILDWYKKSEGVSGYAPAEDPGVRSVTQIYNYYKANGIKTEIMGASFRNKEQILELAGCDLLTIAPKFLEELSLGQGKVARKLDPAKAKEMPIKPIVLDEKNFRLRLNDDAMATEKLSEGIRIFGNDAAKLENLIKTTYKLS